MEDIGDIPRIFVGVKNFGLGFRDSSIINTALKHNAYIVTLDKDLKK